MSEWGFDAVIGALNTSLNLRQMQDNIIASNIANSETPGFKQKVMEFELALRDVLSAHDAQKGSKAGLKDTDPVRPEVFEDPYAVEGFDGNTVNRSEQMALLAENQLLFEASIEMLKKKLAMLKYAILEGGGGK